MPVKFKANSEQNPILVKTIKLIWFKKLMFIHLIKALESWTRFKMWKPDSSGRIQSDAGLQRFTPDKALALALAIQRHNINGGYHWTGC